MTAHSPEGANPTRGAQRLLSGLLSVASASAVVMVLQLGYSAITSRLLAPDAFGAYAVALTVVGFVSLFSGASLGQAAARRAHESEQLDRSLVAMALITSLPLAALTIALAPWAARLWGVPNAAATTRVLCLGIPLVALVAVYSGILRRRGKIMRVAGLSLVGQLLGMALGLASVVVLGTAWSLSVSPVLSSLVTACLLAFAIPGRVTMPIVPGQSLKGEGIYSAKTAGMNVLRYSANALTPWSIGRFGGASALGAYNRATTMITVPLLAGQSALSFSLFPELRPDGPVSRKSRSLTDILVMLSWLSVLLLGFGLIAAGPFLNVVLGPGWEAAASIGWLAVLLGVIPFIEYAAIAALEALGHFRQTLVCWAFSTMATLVGVGAIAISGRTADALAGLVVAKAANAGLACLILSRRGLISGRRLVSECWRFMLAQAGVTVGLLIALETLRPSDMQALVIVACVAVAELLVLHRLRGRTSFGRIAREAGLPGFTGPSPAG